MKQIENNEKKYDSENNKLKFKDKVKIKFMLFLLKILGKGKDARELEKKLEKIEDVTLTMGASSFGLHGLPDFEYDNIYSQLKIDNKYKYIWVKNIEGGIHYEGGGTIYIHNNFKGTIYAPNSCLYFRKNIYGLVEAENSKILVRESNAGYIHSPKGDVQIGDSNFGYIYARQGTYVVLQCNSGMTKGNKKTLKKSQKNLLLGHNNEKY